VVFAGVQRELEPAVFNTVCGGAERGHELAGDEAGRGCCLVDDRAEPPDLFGCIDDDGDDGDVAAKRRDGLRGGGGRRGSPRSRGGRWRRRRWCGGAGGSARRTKTTIKFPLVLGPVYRNFSVLSPTWLAVGIPTFLIVSAVLVRVVLRPPVRRAPVWVSGTAVDIALVQYTPEAYANPIRVVLAGLYGFRRTLRPVGGDASERQRVLTTRVVPGFEQYLYRPIALGSLWLSSRARRLQSGRLSFYLLYVLIALIAILALIPALKD
jgi:hypothetical protein